MALYFVEHAHDAATCPTQHPQMMMALGKHVTQATADEFGIKIHADIVHPGEHRMNMVLEASDEEAVKSYMTPFSQVGSVSIKFVTTCEEVVQTANC